MSQFERSPTGDGRDAVGKRVPVSAPPVIRTAATVPVGSNQALQFPMSHGTVRLVKRPESGQRPTVSHSNSWTKNGRNAAALPTTTSSSSFRSTISANPFESSSSMTSSSMSSSNMKPATGNGVGQQRNTNAREYSRQTSRFGAFSSERGNGGKSRNPRRTKQSSKRFGFGANTGDGDDDTPRVNHNRNEQDDYRELKLRQVSILKKETPPSTESNTEHDHTVSRQEGEYTTKQARQSASIAKKSRSGKSLKAKFSKQPSEKEQLAVENIAQPGSNGPTSIAKGTLLEQSSVARLEASVVNMEAELRRVKDQLNTAASARMSDAQRAATQKLFVEKKLEKTAKELSMCKKELKSTQRALANSEASLASANHRIGELEAELMNVQLSSYAIGSPTTIHSPLGSQPLRWNSSDFMQVLSKGGAAEANAAAAALWGNPSATGNNTPVDTASTKLPPRAHNFGNATNAGYSSMDSSIVHNPMTQYKNGKGTETTSKFQKPAYGSQQFGNKSAPKVVSTRQPTHTTCEKPWAQPGLSTADLVDALVAEAVSNAADEVLGLNSSSKHSQVVCHLTVAEIEAAPYEPEPNVAHRPQCKFEPKPDNSEDKPFFPKLMEKPNAIVPLNLDEIKSKPWLNPYRFEISKLQYTTEQLSHPSKLNEIVELKQDACVTWVDTRLELSKMMEILDDETTVKELAIDLEHHSERSFQGFLCLMQLSTRTQDFIVDTIALRSELHCLNKVFTNPRVVKVLHGADMDILWMQRDLGLYVVNLFDTGQAARELKYPSFSLAHLLVRFVKIRADKSHQLADWRLRPIPKEMLRYAQQDTHYLLDIYDRMRVELLELDQQMHNQQQSRLEAVLHRSSDVCQRTYVKDKYSWERQWGNSQRFATRVGVQLNRIQTQVLASLCQWRDVVARVRDESPNYVIPCSALVAMAYSCPMDDVELQDCFAMPFAQLGKKHQAIQTPALVKEFKSSIFATIEEAMVVAKESQEMNGLPEEHQPVVETAPVDSPVLQSSSQELHTTQSSGAAMYEDNGQNAFMSLPPQSVLMYPNSEGMSPVMLQQQLMNMHIAVASSGNHPSLYAPTNSPSASPSARVGRGARGSTLVGGKPTGKNRKTLKSKLRTRAGGRRGPPRLGLDKNPSVASGKNEAPVDPAADDGNSESMGRKRRTRRRKSRPEKRKADK